MRILSGARRTSATPAEDASTADVEAQLAVALEELAALREALQTLPVGLVVEDGRGQVIATNGRAESPFGDVQADALAADARRRLLERARGGATVSEVMELRGPTRRTLELAAEPLPSGGVVLVAVDNTERRRLEAVRRDFVANVNHELRTPIGALGVLAEALADEPDPAVVSRLAGRIQVEVQRAHHLIEELLDFSRIEADADGASADVDLVEVAAAAAERLSAHAEQRRVAVRGPEQPQSRTVVRGSRPQLLSAITNLLDNAIKYSDAGGSVEVDVDVDEREDAVVVTVRDDGIGIPARDLDRIFERFYRVDAARDRRTGGTGLGLAIVRHVAANHGGSVQVDSTEGVGSGFTLRIPIHPVSEVT